MVFRSYRCLDFCFRGEHFKVKKKLSLFEFCFSILEQILQQLVAVISKKRKYSIWQNWQKIIPYKKFRILGLKFFAHEIPRVSGNNSAIDEAWKFANGTINLWTYVSRIAERTRLERVKLVTRNHGSVRIAIAAVSTPNFLPRDPPNCNQFTLRSLTNEKSYSRLHAWSTVFNNSPRNTQFSRPSRE